MAKTNPIGVRFDEELLNELKEKGYATTAQGVLTLLEGFYRATKLMQMKPDFVKEDEKFVDEPKTEEKEVPSWKVKYDEYIKNKKTKP